MAALQEVAARILETRAIESDPEQLARELFVGFHELCLRLGLDGVLEDLDLADDADGTEHPQQRSALATRLVTDAPREALAWVTRWLHGAIVHGADLHVGRGHGPVHHGWATSDPWS